jgi:hypothetical protein
MCSGEQCARGRRSLGSCVYERVSAGKCSYSSFASTHFNKKQNLYFYAAHSDDEFKQHMLSETLLVSMTTSQELVRICLQVPRLLTPYLERCAAQARQLTTAQREKNESKNTQSDMDHVSGLAGGSPALIKVNCMLQAYELVSRAGWNEPRVWRLRFERS